MIELTVIICTHNRAVLLRDALESLARQSLESARYEIVVVDNASTDMTVDVVNEFELANPELSVLLIQEARPGSGHARATGFTRTRGRYAAFMDDDARADEQWCREIIEVFQQTQPTPIAVGGPILPCYQAPRPKWFKDEYEKRSWGETPRWLSSGEVFSGSNMAFKTDVARECGLFDKAMAGMIGDYMNLSEDTVLFQQLWRSYDQSAALYYSPRIRVHHLVPLSKMTPSYRLKRAFASGQAWHALYGPASFFRKIKKILRLMANICVSTGISLLTFWKYPTYQDWLVVSVASIAVDLGCLAGCLGFNPRIRHRPLQTEPENLPGVVREATQREREVR